MDADTFKPHQESAYLQLKEGKRGLFHPYGLGKTWPSLAVVTDSFTSNDSFVVLCKKRNINTWKRELTKRNPSAYACYEITGGTDWQKVYDEAVATHVKVAPDACQIFLLSYSILASKIDYHIAYLKVLNIKAIIADESTKIKNPKALVTKAALKLANALPHTYRMIMTGNPKPEGEYEVWSQFQFTGKNPFENTYYRFLHNWFVKPQFGPPVLKHGYERNFRTRLEHLGVWIHPTDLVKLRTELGLPFDQYIIERYELNETQRNLLKILYKTWALPDANNITFEMNYALSLNLKAQQICAGFYLDDSREAVPLFEHALEIPKIKALREVLIELLKDNPTRKVIIWRKFKYENELILKGIEDMFRMPPLVGPGADVLNAFYSLPEAKVIIMPVDVSEGFNELVCADVSIFYSNDFSQEKRNQAEARINRMSQNSSIVLHIDLVSSDGRDNEVVIALQNKSLTPARLKTITNKYLKPI